MIKFIQSDEEYDKILLRIEEIFDAELDTPEGKELDQLIKLVEIWENERYPEFGQ